MRNQVQLTEDKANLEKNQKSLAEVLEKVKQMSKEVQEKALKVHQEDSAKIVVMEKKIEEMKESSMLAVQQKL